MIPGPSLIHPASTGLFFIGLYFVDVNMSFFSLCFHEMMVSVVAVNT